jgi:RNA polymerase sigma-70 factor (ECF subfamily)
MVQRGELETLAHRCQQGDLSAFSDLFHRQQTVVYRLALAILRHEKEAEDAVQETFLRVFEQIGRYRHEAAFQTWLTAVAVNVCRDRLRRQKVRRALSLDWLRGRANPGAAGIDDLVADRQQRATLWAQVDQLDEKYRLPLILHYHQGLPCQEIATILNLPTTTIYSRLNDARQHLRHHLLPKHNLADQQELEGT